MRSRRYLSFRWPLAIWNLLFTSSGSYVAKSDHDAAWNRGAYLVQGLGHCGACHTPRGIAWQEKALDDSSADYLSGAELDAWYAPDLRGDMRTGLGSWSKDDIVAFLKNGHNQRRYGVRLDDRRRQQLNAVPVGRRHQRHRDLSEIAAGDIARSRRSPMTMRPPRRCAAATHRNPGAAVYTGTCATCHGLDAKGFSPVYSGARRQSDRARQRSVVAHQPRAERLESAGRQRHARRLPHAAIPAAAPDQQIADVVTFIRNGWGNQAPAVTAADVAKLRKTTDPTSDQVIILKMR